MVVAELFFAVLEVLSCFHWHPKPPPPPKAPPDDWKPPNVAEIMKALGESPPAGEDGPDNRERGKIV